MEKCQPGRFGDQDYSANRTGITNFFWCPKDTDYNVLGDYNNPNLKFTNINLDFCNQTILELTSPGKKCRSIQESLDIFPYILIYYYRAVYFFDQYDFDKPVKFYLNSVPLTIEAGIQIQQLYHVSEKQLILKDYPLSSSIGSRKLTYFTFDGKS